MKYYLINSPKLLTLIFFSVLIVGCGTTLPKDIPLGVTDNEQCCQSKNHNIDKQGNIIDLEAFELEDFKINATRRYYYDYWERATPLSIPGGKVIKTQDLAEMLNNPSLPSEALPILIDVRSDKTELITAQGAIWLNGLGYAYRNEIEDNSINLRLSRDLSILTGQNLKRTLIFMCSSPICALSYNASLRAINLGYLDVYWYRGGVDAWFIAGFPLVRQIISKEKLNKLSSGGAR